MTELTADDIGVAPTAWSELSVEHARRVSAALDAPGDLDRGDALPLLWHWAFFAPVVPTAVLGPDGHPRLPAGGPTAGLPRRMWAGGRVRAEGSLVVGEPAVRRSEVRRAERKSGRSGELLVVTAAHEVEQGGRVVLREEQDLVYRGAPTAPMPAPVDADMAPARRGWRDVVTVEPVQLFRFSAVTSNSHRIHYDLPYARDGEGYPGLVVHGPLTAMLLAGSAHRRGHAGSSFEFRASAPLFGGVPFTLVGEPGKDAVALQAVRNDGVVAMRASLVDVNHGEPNAEG